MAEQSIREKVGFMASRNTFQLGEFVGIARKTGTDTRLVEVKEAAGGLPKSIAETIISKRARPAE